MKDNKIAKEWFLRADHDFSDAVILFKEDGYPDTICFLCHQAAEKYFKGFLIAKEKNFPRIHNLLVLIDKCANFDSRFIDAFEEAKFLNKFYIEARYPINPASMPSKNDAERAIESAETIITITESIFD